MNYKLKLEMDELKNQIDNTCDYSAEFIKNIFDQASEIMKNYKLSIKTELKNIDFYDINLYMNILQLVFYFYITNLFKGISKNTYVYQI